MPGLSKPGLARPGLSRPDLSRPGLSRLHSSPIPQCGYPLRLQCGPLPQCGYPVPVKSLELVTDCHNVADFGHPSQCASGRRLPGFYRRGGRGNINGWNYGHPWPSSIPFLWDSISHLKKHGKPSGRWVAKSDRLELHAITSTKLSEFMRR